MPVRLRVRDAFAAQSGGALGFEYEHSPWSCRYYVETGRMLAPNKLDMLCGFDGGAAQPGGRFCGRDRAGAGGGGAAGLVPDYG